MPEPTKAGHEFQGWYLDPGFSAPPVTAISSADYDNKIFYSKWLQLVTGDVSVTFAGEGSVPRTETCTIVESSMTTLTDTGSTEGWYVVYNNVTFNSPVTISGDVKLVLMDGKTMKVTVSDYKSAVNVQQGNTLTIYAQNVSGTGRLEANGGSISAGIGGNNGQNGGTIIVNGGDVYATCESGGAGIGGGYQANGGMVTINGGTVTAIGKGSGIGGGSSGGNGGTVIINGGYVTVTANAGAGIGCGNSGTDAGYITINGGTIEATGSWRAAGIGGGNGCAGGTVVINGGTVTATGGDGASGIGSGYGNSDYGTLTVGASVVVKSGTSGSSLTELERTGNVIALDGKQYYTAETTGPTPLSQTQNAFAAYKDEAFELALPGTISGGSGSYTFTLKTPANLPAWLSRTGDTLSGTPTATTDSCELTFTVQDTDETSLVEDFTYTITVTPKPQSITYKSGETTLTGLVPTQYTPGTVTDLPATATAPTGYEFAGWYDNDGLTGDPVTAVPASATDDLTFWANFTPIEYPITYMKDAITPLEGLVPATYTIVSGATLPATAVNPGKGFYGWYLNSGCTGDAVTAIPAGETGPRTFYALWGVAKSNETYIDANGVEQTAECIEVGSDTTALETGWYVVKGDVTIPGKVTVTGNVNLLLSDGASLTVNAPSYSHAIDVKGANTLTIYGQENGTGALTATANDWGPGIGSGDSNNTCGTITVNGGIVTATGKTGAGIGGGYNQPGGTVIVNGGTVIATGDSGAGGIGGYGTGYKATGTLRVADNAIAMAKTSDYGARFVVKPHGANGEITLEGEQYYKIIVPKTASIQYRDTDGVIKNANCTLLTTDINSIGDGWYAVTGTLDFGTDGFFVSGDAKLVVADGASLTVEGLHTSPYSAGINVPVGASLTVYGQAEGTGAINATGGYFSAGIGGIYQQSAGTITINGCNVTAVGNTTYTGGAGIGGGGNRGNGGTVTINGGRVEATGSAGAGIGRGQSGTDGTLTVSSSMTVMAGASSSAAVELTPDEVTGEVELSGQTYFLIERTGPKPLVQNSSALAAYKGEATALSFDGTVGGGTAPYEFTFKSGELPNGISSATFSGTPTETGTFEFVVTVTDSAAGEDNQSEDFTYTLTVTARPKSITYMDGETQINDLEPATYVEGVGADLPVSVPAASAPLGYELEGWYTSAACNPGDKVTAISAEATGDQIVYANWKAIVYDVVYMKDSVTQFDDPAATTYTIESPTLTLPTTAVNAGKSFEGWYDNAGGTGVAITEIPHGSTGDRIFYAKWGTAKSNETYVDASGNSMPAVECTVIDSDIRTLGTGWYVAKGDVTIPSYVQVSGNAKLILADGATLTIASDNSYKAGINISSYGSLTVYAQTSTGSGSLVVTGGALAAGIGGEWNDSHGPVTINGGNVTATAGNNGAGIGGGSAGAGGTVVINNGTVTAIGGTFGAGIGGGYQANGGTVTINGGTVTAYSSGYGAGIGKGSSGTNNGSLTVGANMVVESGDDAGSLTELGRDGVIELDGNRYYLVHKAGVAPLTQTTSAIAAYAGEAIEINLSSTVTGGTTPYLFYGTVPTGLTLAENGGALTGTLAADTYPITLTVKDSADEQQIEEFTWTLTVSVRPQPIRYMDGEVEMTNIEPSGYIEGVGVEELPVTASKTGYLFMGWYTAANGGDRVYSISTEATGPQTVYAHWTTQPYSITYKDGNTTLTGIVPTTYDIETATFNLPEPLAPEGKVFVGWYAESTLDTPVASIAQGSTGNRTFWVKWRDAQPGEGQKLVQFLDGDGTPCEEMCTIMTSAMTTLESGWYVLANSLAFTQVVTIDGDVKIVLEDGKSLTVSGGSFTGKPGISLTEGNSLTIYGQTEGTGALTATAATYSNCAGIGTGYNENFGTITINGGVITATGEGGAGIGAGSGGDGGTVVINRGSVTATGGSNGAGIGGDSGNICNVTINGGSVEARGAMMASGIGGGYNKAGGTITITGGEVLAVGGNMAAGIGGGYMGAGGIVNITGGSVTATGGDAGSSGIGAGNGSSSHGELTVGDGMTVYAGAGENPSTPLDPVVPGAGRYYLVNNGTGPVGPTIYEIKYYDHYDEIRNLNPSSYEEGVGATLAIPEKEGYVFLGWYADSNCEGQRVYEIPANATGVQTFYSKWEKAPKYAIVNYLDTDGETKPVECTIIDDARKNMTNGWYAVTNSISFTKGMTVTDDVKLILADGVTLSVSNSHNGEAGINVPSGSSLTIYGQSEGEGAGLLRSTGGESGAGIGGNSQGDSGTITINGGSVTATGGEHGAAGIGGGYSGDCGAVTINGGVVVARGGSNDLFTGAGIGGGNEGSGGTVVINGGSVTATSGGQYADGIGRGKTGANRGTLKPGENVVIRAGDTANPTETLEQKKDDGTLWIFDTYRYYTAEVASATSEFSITYKEYLNNTETVLNLSPATYLSGTGVATIPTPEQKTGYTFEGWQTSQWAHLAEPVTSIPAGSSGDKILWAKWTPNVYDITYVTTPMVIDGIAPATYTYGTGVATLPAPEATKPYWMFDGWYDNDGHQGDPIVSIAATSTGAVTLYAKWVEDGSRKTAVTFQGASGEQTESCRILDTSVTELEDGWYVVNDDLEYTTGISVTGDVKLVLEDGKTLSITNSTYLSWKAGINVPDGSSLTIYAQEDGTGTIEAYGCNEGGAGIGGNHGQSCGALTVYGGRIVATGGSMSAGIGGGTGPGNGGVVTIYGGDVTANGGASGVGIGGGSNPGVDTIGGNGGTVQIYGGVVHANSVSSVGIGKGDMGIEEVALTVGAGMRVQVRDVLGEPDWLYIDPDTGAVQISGSYPTYLVFDAASTDFPITYMDGEDPLVLNPASYRYGDGVASLPSPAAAQGYAFAGWYDNAALNGDPITYIPDTAAGEVTLWAKWHAVAGVAYRDEYGVDHIAPCRILDAGTTQLMDGEWYAVTNDEIVIEGGLTVLGDATLILADGSSLEAGNDALTFNKAGLNVPQTKSLTIYGQENGTGYLYARSSWLAAGIGGNEGESCGTVTINGGRILAVSGDSGAGIGGGFNGTGGDVTINGGQVEARGHDVYCMGIGGGVTLDEDNLSGFMPHGTLTVAQTMAVHATWRDNAESVLARNPATGGIELKNSTHSFRVVPAREFTITYKDGTETMTGLQPVTYIEGTGATLPGVTAVKKTGWTFAGWYDDPESDEAILSVPGTAEENKIFYVKWTEGETADLVKVAGADVLAPTETGVETVWNLATTVIGGCEPLSFAAKDGTRLPAGLTVSGTTLSGYIAREGTYNFTLTVTDALTVPQTLDIDYTLVVTGDPVEPEFTIDENGVLTAVNLKGNTDVTIPGGVTKISNNLLRRCDYLERVTFPDSLKEIGDNAFFGCTNLVRITFGSSLERVGTYAFCQCYQLSCDDPEGLYFPDSVLSIGADAFTSTGLVRVSLPGDLYIPRENVHPGFNYYTTDVIYRTDQTVFYMNGIGHDLLRVDPKQNTDIVIPDVVTKILTSALEDCDTIVNVTIPNSVTNIWGGAFEGCTALKSVDIPDSVLAMDGSIFKDCTSLESVVIPDSVTTIGGHLFYGCTSLTNVTLGAGITEITELMFDGCTSLTVEGLKINGPVERIGMFAFFGCSGLAGELRLPGSLREIGSWSFENCTSLTSVVIPDSVTLIDWGAFENCHALRSVNIGGEEKLLNARSFAAASGRRGLAASSEKSMTIARFAFSSCGDLENATIGKWVDQIGGGAFSGCPKLKNVTVEEANDNFVFSDGMILTKDGETLVSAFGDKTAITVPSGVVTVDQGAFAGYSTLTSVVLPNSVTMIGEAAFSNATKFATVTIPSSVTSIGENAFVDTRLATVYVTEGDATRMEGLVAGTGYDTTEVEFLPIPEPTVPAIDGDDGAEVTGNPEDGYTVVPSTTEGTVEVVIPASVEPEKVTVVVPPTASVKPNGANVAVVKTVDDTPYDITEFIDLPAAGADGVIDLGGATVKEEIVEEILDPEDEDVEIDLDPAEPSITTAKTRPGLVYVFREGTSLDGMTKKATKLGDGTSWTPAISVKGGSSGFYSVGVKITEE